MSDGTFDYIIIGSGSAGSVLANRLTENGRHTVLVLEYGGSDIGPLIQMPSALSIPLNTKTYNWGYLSEPEPGLNNRRITAPRGKVIGGSSSINGMVYVRGHARDFDTWSELGATGWAYADVLPYYKRMETSHGGEEGWRGTDGPLHVTRGERTNPLYHAFVDAAEQAGYPTTIDYNGQQQEGFGAMEMTVWKGRRWSSANAYLKPAMKRDNLELVTRAKARRIVLENKRATGVEYEKGGRIKTANARREVIIAASAFNSPHLLQLSGIGDAATLKAAGIEPVHHLPGVGANLMDHLEVYFQLHSKKPVTLNTRLGLISKGLIGLQWLLFKTGLGATNHFESAGFIRSRAGIEYPDIQYHFLPGAIAYDGKPATKGHGFQVHVGPNRSKSRGMVMPVSANPDDAPKLTFNYMSKDEDWTDFRSCIRLTREIIAQPAMQEFANGEIQPGDDVTSDAAIDDFIRRHAESAYHPCGTCKMGSEKDPMAVVDPQCRVIGIEGLRVADSSIFPSIPNGNLNGPSLMVGEKASDHILGLDPLPPSNQQPWINPDWQNSQR
ncbi:choline dehydrogenase [Anderseniella sp. Alg231-50]|uniref:choline dehydrogenase n=1 Tax=Anderseniella sp. Alg231-50 TaxID=1922226 RepID=UPI000D5509AD